MTRPAAHLPDPLILLHPVDGGRAGACHQEALGGEVEIGELVGQPSGRPEQLADSLAAAEAGPMAAELKARLDELTHRWRAVDAER